MEYLYRRYGITCIVREAEPVWDTCFLAVSAARTQFYDIFAPGTIGEMGLHPTKLEKMARSAVILTIDYNKTQRSRRNVQSIPPIMKNERPKPSEIY